MTPEDTQTIYNLQPLYQAGYSGQGQTIYLVEDTDSYGNDWQTYRSTFGLATNFPQGSFATTHPGSCTDPGTNADDGEANIDVEVASAIAPSAAINLISCPSGTVTFGGLIALQNLINQNNPTVGVVSMSYGVCEVAMATVGTQPSMPRSNRRLRKASLSSSPPATKVRRVVRWTSATVPTMTSPV